MGKDQRVRGAEGTNGRGAVAAAVEIAWWWGVAVGVWLLTLSSVSMPELAVATASGLPCALAARAGRRAVRSQWRPRLRWAAWLVPLIVSIPADAARLLPVAIRALARRKPGGELRELRMPAGEAADVSRARHALASVIVSATPGTFVVDSNPEEDTLVVHSLVSGWPDLDEVVRR